VREGGRGLIHTVLWSSVGCLIWSVVVGAVSVVHCGTQTRVVTFCARVHGSFAMVEALRANQLFGRGYPFSVKDCQVV
jgi:hypothetical protein